MSTPSTDFAGTLSFRRSWRTRLLPWALMAPTAVFAIAVALVPLAYLVRTSVQEYRLGQSPAFVGLQNYRNVLVDESFRASVLITLVLMVVVTGCEFIGALGLRLL